MMGHSARGMDKGHGDRDCDFLFAFCFFSFSLAPPHATQSHLHLPGAQGKEGG